MSGKSPQNSDHVLGVTTQLYRELAEVQHDLSKYLSFIPDLRPEDADFAQMNKNKTLGERFESFGKFLSTKTASSATVGGHAQYIQLVEEVLGGAYFLESCMEASMDEVCPAGVTVAAKLELPKVLARVASFFERVICAMVVADLGLLLEHHLQQERGSFDKAVASAVAADKHD